jgi:hypothetical protein
LSASRRFICTVGKPPTLTARSSDHLTSLAVTGVPSWNFALPLYGVPFAVKDNIDALGLPTTAACPAFSYSPAHDATAVANCAPPAPS